MILTEEQKDLISEFKDEAIKLASGKNYSRLMEFSKRILYDHKNGIGSSQQVVISYILGLSKNDPDNPILSLLEQIIPKGRFHSWLIADEYQQQFGQLPVEKITFDGFGYVILSNGYRVDFDAKMYQVERKAFNNKKLTDN